MQPFVNHIVALTHQKIVPGDTATQLSKYCYNYKAYRLNVDDVDVDLAVGSRIVGITSAAVAVVRYASLSATTNGTGYVICDSWNGTAWTNDEEIGLAGSDVAANVNQPKAWREATDEEYALAGRLIYKDSPAKAAQVVVLTNTALVTIDGSKPNQDASTGLAGLPLVANATLELGCYQEIANFYCIDYTSSSASIVNVTFYF